MVTPEARVKSVPQGRREGAVKGSISVHATGEVACPPDVLEFLISVSSTKDNLESSLESVTRRSEYILQVLRNNGVKDRCIRSTSEITKGEESVTVHADTLVRINDLVKCEKVRNLLIEKLDRSVLFSPITCYHSLEEKENKRQESFRRAVLNAKAKAQCIAQTVGVQLGPATEVVELSQDRSEDTSLAPGLHALQETALRTEGLHQRYAKETMTYTSDVSVVFETRPLLQRSCTHKKCPKH